MPQYRGIFLLHGDARSKVGMTRIEANSTLHFMECLRFGAFHAGREDHHDLFHAGAVHAQNAERVTLNLDFGAR